MKGMVKLKKQELLNVNFKNYVYENKQGEQVKNFFIDEFHLYFPRNIKKLKENYKGEFESSCLEQKVDKEVKLSTGFKLKESQETVLSKFNKNWSKGVNDCILNAYTGFGKSFIVPAIINSLQQKTTIIVDLTMLQDQMYKEIIANCDADIQICNKDSDRVADVNIVTIQLLNKNKNLVKLLASQTGLVILDECHNAGAETIKTIVQKFPAKYRIGLSATPTRSDGLDDILTDVFSDNVILGKGTSIPLDIHIVKDFEYYFEPYEGYAKALKKAILDNWLGTLDGIVDKAMKKNKSIMIAVNSEELQELFKKRYEKFGTAVLNGKTKKDEREKILDDYEKEKYKILLGYKVLKKGISIPRMEILINVFGATTKEDLEQLAGRLTRSHKVKTKGTFIDFTWGASMFKQEAIKQDTFSEISKKLDVTIKIFNKEIYDNLLRR